MPSKRATSVRHRQRPEPLAKTVGARIRRLRQAQSYTFDAFVEETELGRGYISELERGLVVPTIQTLQRVARALEVTVADLVLGDTPRERLFDELRDVDDQTIEQLLADLRRTRAPAVVAGTREKRGPR